MREPYNSKCPHSVTFFYPSKVLGGAEYLFIRLAKRLKSSYKVYYVDYIDGFARSQLNDTDIVFIDFLPWTRMRLPEQTCLIAPLSSIIDVCISINLNSHLTTVFWSIHPLGLASRIRDFSKYNILNGFFKSEEDYTPSLSLMHSDCGLYFMDGANYYIQSEIFKLTLENPNYIPIPIEEIKEITNIEASSSAISIGWLGRLSYEKIQSLINVLKHAIKYSKTTGKKIDFHVIGEGEFGHLIESVPGLDELNLIRVGTLGDIAVKDYLTKISVLFAMGTSALEGARLKIPTVLVDFCEREIPLSNHFRWLFESSEYTLGNEHSASLVYPHKFDAIISSLTYEDNRQILGSRCHEYFMQHHEINYITTLLKKAIQSSSFNLLKLKSTKFGRFRYLQLIVPVLKSIIK